MRGHCEVYGLLVEALRGSRTSDSSAVLETGVFGDEFLPPGRTVWKQRPHLSRESPHVLLIQFRAPCRLALLPAGPHVTVSQALLFGQFQGGTRDQKPLPLVPLSGATLLHDDRGQG